MCEIGGQMTHSPHSDHVATTTMTKQKGSIEQKRAKLDNADLQCSHLLEDAVPLNVMLNMPSSRRSWALSRWFLYDPN